jgi:hypothetical protein
MNSKIDEATIERKYDRAISLMKYQTELLWKEFEAFLLAETVLIGFLGTTLTKEEAGGDSWFNYLHSMVVYVSAYLRILQFTYGTSQTS